MTATTELQGIVLDLPDAEYRQAPGLSSTGVKYLLDSPARYQWEQAHRTEKKAFDLGHVVHAVVLGAGLDVAVIDHPDYRTKAAREERDEARAEGRAPILRHEWEQVAAMRDAVLAHPDARALLEAPGDPEVSAFWTDPYTGVACKGRFDRILDAPVLVDLKSGRTADPRKFGKHAADFGYAEQAAHYRDGVFHARGEEHRFLHLIVESDRPHLVSVVELDEEFLRIGEERRRFAVELYSECMESGEWPGFGHGIHRVGAPRWFSVPEVA